MRKGRGCNLAAGIIDIVYAGLLLIGALYILLLASTIGGIPADIFGGLLTYIAIIALVFAGSLLTFGIITIKICNKETEDYYQKSAPILVFSIIESVFLGLMFAGSETGESWIGIALLLAIVILHWIGFGMMKKGAKEEDAFAEPVILPKREEIKEQANEVAEPVEQDKLQQLEKLVKLKKSGALTEKEFQAVVQ